MMLLRFLALAFNVAVVVFLIYRMLEVSKRPIELWKKRLVVAGGIILILAPLAMFFRFIPPTFQYFFIYPAAIGLYLYMIREM